ncbi:S1 RNA-binding domain-containing protein [Streptomyces sp. BR123]|nr:S1 RNA-binding domain-containing protein [Streptomyces sp. BR123]
MRRVQVIGFDGTDTLVRLLDTEGDNAEVGRIPRHEASMRRHISHPSEIFEVGREMEAEEIGRRRGEQLSLSARACENQELRSFLTGIRPGQVVSGTVSGVHDFGVFVRLDGEPAGVLTGFVRVPDLSWSWIDHPSQAVEPGQRITAEVITSETRKGQVTISLKALQDNPFADFASRIGQVLDGTITKIVPFGVFVQVAPGVEGLLHVSELTDEPVESPAFLVREGALIRVRVAEVDTRLGRVGLRAVADAADAADV